MDLNYRIDYYMPGKVNSRYTYGVQSKVLGHTILRLIKEGYVIESVILKENVL